MVAPGIVSKVLPFKTSVLFLSSQAITVGIEPSLSLGLSLELSVVFFGSLTVTISNESCLSYV